MWITFVIPCQSFITMLTTFNRRFSPTSGSKIQSASYTFILFCWQSAAQANTYRQIRLFIHTNFDKLSSYFESLKAAPHHTTIRNHIKVSVQMNWKLLSCLYSTPAACEGCFTVKVIITLQPMVKPFEAAAMQKLQKRGIKVFHFSMLFVVYIRQVEIAENK